MRRAPVRRAGIAGARVAPPVRVCGVSGHPGDTPRPDVRSPRCACSPVRGHPRLCHHSDVHPQRGTSPCRASRCAHLHDCALAQLRSPPDVSAYPETCSPGTPLPRCVYVWVPSPRYSPLSTCAHPPIPVLTQMCALLFCTFIQLCTCPAVPLPARDPRQGAGCLSSQDVVATACPDSWGVPPAGSAILAVFLSLFLIGFPFVVTEGGIN